MIRVHDLESAAKFYQNVLGLAPLWSDEHSATLEMPESDAEIVLHDDPKIPRDCNAHYLVDDVVEAVTEIGDNGGRVAPFDVRIGKCAVVSDPFGNQLNLLNMTKGRTQAQT